MQRAEPLFIISRSHCAGASSAVFAMDIGLPKLLMWSSVIARLSKRWVKNKDYLKTSMNSQCNHKD